MEKQIISFMENCFPGIENYPSGPILAFYKEMENNAIVFCTHRVTDVFNDIWEIKSDDFFLFLDGVFYHIESITTNYEQNVFGHNADYLNSNLCIMYGINSTNAIKQKNIDRKSVV